MSEPMRHKANADGSVRCKRKGYAIEDWRSVQCGDCLKRRRPWKPAPKKAKKRK